MTPDPGSAERAASAGVVLEATVVHDAAMLGRVVAVLGPHPVGAFSYLPRLGAASLATITVEVTGDSWQVRRVCAKLERIIGVLEVGSRADGEVWRGSPCTRDGRTTGDR